MSGLGHPSVAWHCYDQSHLAFFQKREPHKMDLLPYSHPKDTRHTYFSFLKYAASKLQVKYTSLTAE